MKRYKFTTLLTLVIIGTIPAALIVVSCGGGGSSQTKQDNTDPNVGVLPLTDSQEAYLESLDPIPTPDPTSIVLNDGLSLAQVQARYGLGAPNLNSFSSGSARTTATQPSTPQEYKDRCVGAMVGCATYLLPGTYPTALLPDGTGSNEPHQTQLAYVYGSRTLTSRTLPTDQCCKNNLFGTDCSGLIYFCANVAGLKMTKSQAYAATQSNKDTWNSLIPSAWNITMKKLSSGSQAYQAGDILCWKGHIGIVITPTTVIQCEGGEGCKVTAVCTTNYDANHGPRLLSISKANTDAYFGTPIAVLRLSTGDNLAGTWTGTETLNGFADCTSSTGEVSFTFVDKNGAAGGPISASFTSTISPGGGSYPFLFTGTRTNNSYTLTDPDYGLTYTGTLVVDPTSPSLDTITVSKPYFCGDQQSPTNATYSLSRNENGLNPSVKRLESGGCPSCLSNSKRK